MFEPDCDSGPSCESSSPEIISGKTHCASKPQDKKYVCRESLSFERFPLGPSECSMALQEHHAIIAIFDFLAVLREA